MDAAKDFVVTIHSLPSENLAAVPSPAPISRPPRVTALEKLHEFVYLGLTKLRVILNEGSYLSANTVRPLSEKGLFTYFYVEPLFQWWGRNLRILKSQSLGVVEVSDESGLVSSVVNGASHNYAGLYKATSIGEGLQRRALDILPVSDSDAVPLLRDAVHQAVAKFLDAAFCFTTSTGYGSNYVAFPALVESTRTAVILDADCHNSMFTGVFLAQCKNLWKFKHNNLKHLEEILSTLTGRFDTVIVGIEGLYSMEGDVPHLDGIYKLKQEYGFVLYCDEAHSFLSLGATGRGVLEFWNDEHPEACLPWDLIDIRTATLSKAIGGIGGIIVGKTEFEEPLQRHVEKLKGSEILSLPTSTMVQTLSILGQPSRTARNLRRLSSIAAFCRSELARAGVFVYGTNGTPILPVWTGRPSKAAELSYELRGVGVLASPVSTPAVPMWASRVRVNLSADYSDQDVDRLITAIVTAATEIGICKKTSRQMTRLFGSLGVDGVSPVDEDSPEELATREEISALIEQSALNIPTTIPIVPGAIITGHESRVLYGIGSGSARWISGTFPPHIAVESILAERSGAEMAMTYADGEIGLASTVAALSRPLKGVKRHFFLYPRQVHRCVRDGLKMVAPATRKAHTTFGSYVNTGSLVKALSCIKEKTKDGETAYTVYLRVIADDAPEPEEGSIRMSNVFSFALELVAQARPGHVITLVIHSTSETINTKYLVESVARPNLHVLVYGSLMDLCGLPGGYLAGPERLIRELRYTSRGYMFTTSAPPFVMSMICAALEGPCKASG